MILTDFWKYTGPYAPWGPFDPDDSVNFTFDATDLVTTAGVALSLSGCDILIDAKLKVLSKSFVGNLITIRVERDAAVLAKLGDRMKLITRIFLSDGQHFDQTWNLLLLES